MPSVDQFVAESASALFDAWAVGDVLEQANALVAPIGDEALRLLLRGVDALIRRGLREQCETWPRERSTDGVSAYRCVRRTALEVEVIGLCWAFTPKRGSFASFPVRATFELDPAASGLAWFRCDVGDVDPNTAEIPRLPEGATILFDDDDETGSGVQLLIGRRPRPIAWTQVVSLRFT
jgi:hypothetical protein